MTTYFGIAIRSVKNKTVIKICDNEADNSKYISRLSTKYVNFVTIYYGQINEKTKSYTFIDLFAGAGGLSEGFIRAGYTPIAHIEMNKDACNTLKTRSAFHYLQKNGMLSIYEDYLRHKEEGTDGRKLWDQSLKA